MSKLRCAVLGAGYLGRFHAQKYHSLSHVDLVGVYDKSEQQAKNLADELSVPVIHHLQDLIGHVDAVSIAAITPAHYELAKFCLSHGLHVLIEKPMTIDLAEADELNALAAAEQRVLQVGHLERFNAAYQAFVPHLKQPQMIETQRLASFKKRGSEVDVILDLMIHDLDIILSWINSPVAHIHAQGLSMLTDGVDLANVSLQFANGCCAHLSASRVHTSLERMTRVYQGKDYYVLNYQTQVLSHFQAQMHADLGYQLEETVFETPKQDALLEQIKAFVAKINGEDASIVDGVAGRQALALALEIQKNIQRVRHFA